MITQEEKNTILGIVERYRSIHSDLGSCERDLILMSEGEKEKDPDQIKILREKIILLVGELNSERDSEKIFLKKLEEKYGEGELLIPSFEYKLKNEK